MILEQIFGVTYNLPNTAARWCGGLMMFSYAPLCSMMFGYVRLCSIAQ